MAAGIIGIVLGTANFVNATVRGELTTHKLDEMKEMLQQIQTGVDDIRRNLEVVLSEIQWTQVVVVLSDSISSIEFQYAQMMEIDPEDKSAAKAWLANVNTENILQALFTIHQAMIGEMILLPGAVMQVLTDKLAPLTYDKLPQSRKWLAVDYYTEMLAVQGKGYAVIVNAYTAEGKETKAVIAELRQRFTTQGEVSAKFIDPLSSEYQNIGWGDSYFGWHDHAPYVDTHKVVADDGKVVVGLQLYQKNNRIGLKIAQATPEFGPVDEKQSSSTWKENPNWGDEYFKLKGEYVDTNINILPDGSVVTGAALYKKGGNRLAIQLLGTKIDPTSGKLTEPGKWQESPGWGSDYFKGSDAKYCDTHTVIPSVLSCMSGAAIYQKDNRVAVKIYTVCTRYAKGVVTAHQQVHQQVTDN